jgi:hypothetical protein
VHRRHRIPRIDQIPRPQLRGQHRELRDQQRRVLDRELPAHPDLG